MQAKRGSWRTGAAVVVLVVGAGWMQGCSTAGTTAVQSQGQDQAALQFEDRALASQIVITGTANKQVGDLMQAQVSLQSRRDRSLRVQYRFAWFDAGGVELERTSQPYYDLIIEGRDAVTVSAVAPSASATTYRVKLRKPRFFRIDNLWW